MGRNRVAGDVIPTSLEVAFYDQLISQARLHLPTEGDSTDVDSIAIVLKRVAQLRQCLDAVETSLTPKKVTEKTQARAAGIVGKVNDALRLFDAWTSKDELE